MTFQIIHLFSHSNISYLPESLNLLEASFQAVIFSHVLYFLFEFLMQQFEHFNVIELYKLNIIIIYYQYYICAQFVTNCLQSYDELHVCGNLMYNTHSIGNKYLANIYRNI